MSLLYNQITKPEEVTLIEKIGPSTVKITYDSGKVVTANSIVWSTTSHRSTDDDPTGGYLNLVQMGATSSMGLVGVPVSVVRPLTFDATTYTDLGLLITEKLLTLGS